MAFLKIPFEIRLKIYRALLLSPEGIDLYTRYYDVPRLITANKGESKNKELDCEDDSNLEDGETDIEKHHEATIRMPLPVAILCANRQIAAEASEVLYGSNRFVFDAGGRLASISYDPFPPKVDPESTDLGLVHMPLAQVPLDLNHTVDKSKETIHTLDSERYWWPAVTALTKLLMDGKIQSLRLAYGATYLNRKMGEDESSGCRGVTRSNDDFDNEEQFTAINNIRYSRPSDDFERCEQEFRGFYNNIDFNDPQEKGKFDALERAQKKRGQRLNFVVNRVDSPPGDIGTVLVLTRPTGH